MMTKEKTDSLPSGSGFWSGFFLGAVVSVLGAYTLRTPEGKKEAKKWLEKAEKFLSDLEAKTVTLKEEVPAVKQLDADVTAKVKSLRGQLRKRFFVKSGRKMKVKKS